MSDLALLGSWAWMAGAVAVNVLWQGALLGAVAAAGLALLRGFVRIGRWPSRSK